MTARNDFDRLLTTWLTDEVGPVAQPSYVTEPLDLVARTEQRRTLPWSGYEIPRRWTRIDLPVRTWLVVVVTLLMIALVVAALIGAFRQPSPTPTGPGRILVTTLDGPLAVVSPDGGVDELPQTDGVPTMASVSPDGTRVAWWSWVVETSPDGMETTTVPLTVAGLDGSKPMQVLDGVNPLIRGVEGRPQWSPDGRFIVFGSGGTIYRVEVDAGDVGVLVGDRLVHRSAPVWSPDGARIAFHASPASEEPVFRAIGSVHTVRADGTEEIVVSGETPVWAGNFGPTWSADSRRLAFVTPRTVSDPQFGEFTVPGGIAVTSLEGSVWATAPVDGVEGLGDQVMLDWAPRGERLAYMREGEPTPDGLVPSVLMLVEGDGSLRQVTTEGLAQGFCWAPDATRIAAMLLDDGLVALDVETGEVVGDLGIGSLNVGDACVWSAWAGEAT
jgi:hypothetical protein